jgi:phosphate-selective porin OprO and OprP
MNNLFKKTAIALAIASGFGTSAVMADEASTKGGIKVKSDDGQFVGQIGGRMHLDVNEFSNDGTTSNESGTDFRRLRLEAKGTMFGVWEGKIQMDFGTGRSSGISSSTTVKDAYLAYTGWGPGTTYFGQTKVPMGLDELTSSNSITFMERAMVMDAVAPNHRRGVQYAGSTGNSSYQAMVYAGDDRLNNDAATATVDTSASAGLAGRWTFTPIKDKTQVLHLGISGAKEEGGEAFNDVSTRYEARLAEPVKVLDVPGATNAINDADGITRLGLEAAYVTGPFSVQAEYLKASVDSALAGDPEVSGHYVALSYFLTGETRPYKASAGVFDRVKPEAKSGAWEATLRHSSLKGESDLVTVLTGEVDNITAGLTYYANPQVRFMFNLSQADLDDTAAGAAVNGSPRTIAARAQFDF